VRTKREKNFGSEPCETRCAGVDDALAVEADNGATSGWSPGSPVLCET
jgi:hypothetical protein